MMTIAATTARCWSGGLQGGNSGAQMVGRSGYVVQLLCSGGNGDEKSDGVVGGDRGLDSGLGGYWQQGAGAGVGRSVEALERAAYLWRLHETAVIVWIPGHCNVPGNEEADRLEAEGGGMEHVPLESATRQALIRREIAGEEVGHPRLRQVYRREIREKEEETLSRRDRVDLTRFRTGHHPALRRWLVLVGREESPDCRLCRMGDETSEHLWIDCEALVGLRRRHQLGSEMAELVEQPAAASAMLRDILSRLRWLKQQQQQRQRYRWRLNLVQTLLFTIMFHCYTI